METQGEPPMVGVGGLLIFSNSHTMSFKACIGYGYNSLDELMALNLTLILIVEYGFTSI